MMKLAIKKKSFPILRWFSLLRILVGILLTLHIFLYLRHSNILSHNNQGGSQMSWRLFRSSKLSREKSADRFGSGEISDAKTSASFLGSLLWGGVASDSVQGAAVDLPFEAEKTAWLGGKVNSSSSTGGDVLAALGGEESEDKKSENAGRRWIRATRVGAAAKRRSSPQEKIIEEAREVLQGGSEEGADDPPGDEKRDPLMGVLSAQDNWDLKRIESALKFEIVEAQKEEIFGGGVEEQAAEGGAEEEESFLLSSENTLTDEPEDRDPRDSEPKSPARESEPEEPKPQTPKPVRESRPEPKVENPETPGDAERELSSPEVVRNQAERRRLLQRRIDEQLAPFRKGAFTYADVTAQKNRTEMSVHFIVEPGNITLIKDPDELSDNWSYWFRADQVRQLFALLSEQKRIPDHIEIVVNIEASPRLNRSVETTDLPPVLSYCSTADHYDLIGIGWQYHRCLKEKYKDNAMCKVGWDPDVIRKEHPWGGREGQALWRGSPTGGLYRIEDWKEKPRSKLVILSKENPDVLDAMFTPCVEGQCTEDGAKAIGEELGYADRLANFDDYMHHKYLVDIDGESWSSRFFQLLASGATVFKQATHYREFSDFFFSAGTHYEQYAADLSDLLPLLKGAQGRQEELGRMADRSLTLVKHLVEDDVTLEYLGMLLTSYTELFATEGGVER